LSEISLLHILGTIYMNTGIQHNNVYGVSGHNQVIDNMSRTASRSVPDVSRSMLRVFAQT